jgi:hypothetical protein
MAQATIDNWLLASRAPAFLLAARWLARDIPASERHGKVVVLAGGLRTPLVRTLYVDAAAHAAPSLELGVPSELQRVLVLAATRGRGASEPDDTDACGFAWELLDVTAGSPDSFTTIFGGVPSQRRRARLYLGELTVRVVVQLGDVGVEIVPGPPLVET